MGQFLILSFFLSSAVIPSRSLLLRAYLAFFQKIFPLFKTFCVPQNIFSSLRKVIFPAYGKISVPYSSSYWMRISIGFAQKEPMKESVICEISSTRVCMEFIFVCLFEYSSYQEQLYLWIWKIFSSNLSKILQKYSIWFFSLSHHQSWWKLRHLVR